MATPPRQRRSSPCIPPGERPGRCRPQLIARRQLTPLRRRLQCVPVRAVPGMQARSALPAPSSCLPIERSSARFRGGGELALPSRPTAADDRRPTLSRIFARNHARAICARMASGRLDGGSIAPVLGRKGQIEGDRGEWSECSGAGTIITPSRPGDGLAVPGNARGARSRS